MTEKRNTDYSKSAVNLTNPGELIPQLGVLLALKGSQEVITREIQEAIPKELNQKLLDITSEISKVETTIKESIEKYGSFQNVEKGIYALKQRKVTRSYDAGVFKLAYPQYSPAVIVETVDTVKLGGLIKGGLITEESLKINGVVEEKESFQYIIKV